MYFRWSPLYVVEWLGNEKDPPRFWIHHEDASNFPSGEVL